MSPSVLSWWTLLCTVAGLNVVAWFTSAAMLSRRHTALSAEIYALRRRQLLLSAVYVSGCAFRSVLPVYDIPRICLFDSWLSSVVVGRSVATAAELCFVAQWALLLRAASDMTGGAFARKASLTMLPLILVAEICSWYSVLTTSNLGHVIEESLWGLVAALLVVSLVSIWPRCNPRIRLLFAIWCAIGVGYVAYMFLVDVPMYWSRWLTDEASGRHYLSIAQGMLDVSLRWVVSHRWADWKSEVDWMSMYFSLAVWLSIALVHAPLPERISEPARLVQRKSPIRCSPT